MKKYRKKIKEFYCKLFNQKVKTTLRQLLAIVTFVATIATLISLFMSMKQTKKLELIAGEVSTRSLGFFPNYFEDIILLMNKAKENDTITIFKDALGYGIYSESDKFNEYLSAIIKASDRGVVIDIYVYNSEFLHELGRNQLKVEDKSDQSLKTIGINKRQYEKAFLKKQKFTETTLNEINSFKNLIFYNTDITLSLNVYYEKLDTLFAFMEKKLNNLKTCQVIPVDKELSIYFWKLNNKEAVYSFPRKKGIQEIAFYTRDIHFLNYLSVIKSETKDENHNSH